MLAQLSPQQILSGEPADEKIQSVPPRLQATARPSAGVKVIAESKWFAARPSEIEEIYKIHADGFRGMDDLRRILEEAQAIVGAAVAAPTHQPVIPSKTKLKDKR